MVIAAVIKTQMVIKTVRKWNVDFLGLLLYMARGRVSIAGGGGSCKYKLFQGQKNRYGNLKF